MEKNKYYIPELEEFHYGFEFEMIPSIGLMITSFEQKDEERKILWATKYNKEIFGQSEAYAFGIGYPDIQAGIKAKTCRVKYLDRDDIESLGFEFVGELLDSSSYRRDNLGLIHKHKDNTISTFTADPMVSEDQFSTDLNIDYQRVGRLTIKNKCELKKFLKQQSPDGR